MIRDEMRTSQDGCSLSPLHRQTTCQFPHPSIHRQDGSRTPSPRLPRILHSPHAIDPGQRAEPSDRAMGQTRQKRAGERKGTALARVAPGVGCITDSPTRFSLTSHCQRAARMEPGQLKRASRWRGPNLQKRDPTELSMEPFRRTLAEGIHGEWTRTWVLFLFGSARFARRLGLLPKGGSCRVTRPSLIRRSASHALAHLPPPFRSPCRYAFRPSPPGLHPPAGPSWSNTAL